MKLSNFYIATNIYAIYIFYENLDIAMVTRPRIIRKTEWVVNPDFKFFLAILFVFKLVILCLNLHYTVYHKNFAMQHRGVVAMEIIIVKKIT